MRRRYLSTASCWVDRLVALFTPDVLFRGLTPGRRWEAHSPAELVHNGDGLHLVEQRAPTSM